LLLFNNNQQTFEHAQITDTITEVRAATRESKMDDACGRVCAATAMILDCVCVVFMRNDISK